ncbi:MAG: antibiotic biosynthesis monooxygenase [Phycisphaerae bacterium]
MITEFVLVSHYHAKPGCEAALETALRNRVPITRTEAGTLEFRLLQARDNPAQFMIFGRFRSEKAFDIHLYEPYTLSLLAHTETLVAAPPRIETYQMVM